MENLWRIKKKTFQFLLDKVVLLRNPKTQCVRVKSFLLGLKKNLVNVTNVSQVDFNMLSYFIFWWGSSCCSCSFWDMGNSEPLPPKLSQKPISSLSFKFQPSSTPPSDIFWWGVVLLLLLVTGVKQSQLLVLKTKPGVWQLESWSTQQVQ